MNSEVIQKLAELFTMMKSNGEDVEAAIKKALGLTPPAPREEVRWFANQMEKVLRENDDKGGWNHEAILSLVSKLLFELGELADALENGDSGEVRKECVDVANYAMMIADNHR